MNVFGIAAFRSRQQVMHFEGVFNREGIPVRRLEDNPHA